MTIDNIILNHKKITLLHNSEVNQLSDCKLLKGIPQEVSDNQVCASRYAQELNGRTVYDNSSESCISFSGFYKTYTFWHQWCRLFNKHFSKNYTIFSQQMEF